MIITRKAISRRALLRGGSAALALPLLDAMTPALAAATPRPKRLGFIETPNGIWMDHWTPAKSGADWALTPTLEPLAPFRDRMLILSGLDQHEAAARGFEIGGDHPRACAAWLTGAHCKMTSGADIRAGISVDQVAAREFRKYTQLASLEIGLDPPDIVGACESAYSCAYYNTVSWLNETTPLPMENRPRAVFVRLFGESGTDSKLRRALRQDDRSILDAVGEDVRRLRGKLGGSDRGKLDQYVDAVRDVERRIQLAETQDTRDLPRIEGPAGTPSSFTQYYRLMTDLMVLAYQTDMTRVCTFQIGHEMGGRSYPEVGFGDAHHSVTHHQGDQAKIEKVKVIDRFLTEQLAYYLGRLSETPDGDTSLLDNMMLLYGSSISDGNLHLYTNLPTLVIAGSSTGIKGGQHVSYKRGTPLNNLFLTMLDTAGVPHVPSLGDSNGRLQLPMA
jgi:hypothetical protein